MTNTDQARMDLSNIENGELSYTRVYDVPREVVFRCLTEPEHLSHFWGPAGIGTPVENIEVDLRPGGVFNTTMVIEGVEYPRHCVYEEVVVPEKLVWTGRKEEQGLTTTITLVDLGDGRTEVTSHQTGLPEVMRSPEAMVGKRGTYETFATYVATLKT